MGLAQYTCCFLAGNLLVLTYFLLFDSITTTINDYFNYFPSLLNKNRYQTVSDCKFTSFNPFDPSLLPYISHPKEISCRYVQPDLTSVDNNGFVLFNDSAISALG